jgi:hypothetical protein
MSALIWASSIALLHFVDIDVSLVQAGLRNVFYTNTGVKRLLGELAGGSVGRTEPTAGLARSGRQLEIKDRRILQLEQRLASVKAEAEELRRRLAAAEQELTRYRATEF